MSQRFELNVEARETGKSTSRALRRGRKIPAVIYGAIEPKNISIDEGAVKKYHVRAFENSLFNLKSDDSKLNNIVVLMKEVVVHPLTRRPQHVDLFALDLKKAVRIFVEIKLEGKPIGLAEGGLLNVVNRQLEIECLPTAIPENITVDISGLGIGDALHVSDLKTPAGVKVLSAPELTVAVVNLFVEEVVEPTAAAADAATATAAGGAAAAGAAPAKDAGAAKKEEKK
ncbi:MAG: 50S ribosomal protein L25 [Bdellovibrio sp. CG10_big_fil_rev_8_21_14_0_10_47_8]|nr:MAG: 50S ribosomal protein L25 [Bdellovibrio sp. CG10_big_fil_rev_8_21_14_0_10_47_8]